MLTKSFQTKGTLNDRNFKSSMSGLLFSVVLRSDVQHELIKVNARLFKKEPFTIFARCYSVLFPYTLLAFKVILNRQCTQLQKPQTYTLLHYKNIIFIWTLLFHMRINLCLIQKNY